MTSHTRTRNTVNHGEFCRLGYFKQGSAGATASVYNLRLPPKTLQAAHGAVASARVLELTLIVGSAGLMASQGGLESYRMRTCCFRNIFLLHFLNIFMESWNCVFFMFFLGASGEGLFPEAPVKGFFPRELLPISPFHFVYKRLCVKTSLCKSLSE